MAEYKATCKDCLHDGVCYTQEVCVDILQTIRDFGCDDFKPTADVVEVRHGEWVQDVYDKMMDIYRCSCCETSWSVIDNDMERFNYCPNCGAKMDGKGEGE